MNKISRSIIVFYNKGKVAFQMQCLFSDSLDSIGYVWKCSEACEPIILAEIILGEPEKAFHFLEIHST